MSLQEQFEKKKMELIGSKAVDPKEQSLEDMKMQLSIQRDILLIDQAMQSGVLGSSEDHGSITGKMQNMTDEQKKHIFDLAVQPVDYNSTALELMKKEMEKKSNKPDKCPNCSKEVQDWTMCPFCGEKL